MMEYLIMGSLVEYVRKEEYRVTEIMQMWAEFS